MSFCPPCGICCTACAAKQPKTPLNHAAGDRKSQPSEPFVLGRLFAAGSLVFARVPQQEPPSLCDHVHADDGWHEFDGMWESGFLTPDDATLSQNISFLVKNDFVRATYNITSASSFTVRIYFVQNNLKNMKGMLLHRNRKDKLLYRARPYLRDVINKVTRNCDQWYGQPPENLSDLETLGSAFGDDGTSLAELYRELPSPRAEDYGNETVARLLNHDDDLEGMGFRSVLYRYQRETVAAMIAQEVAWDVIHDPLYINISTVEVEKKKKWYRFQPGTMEIMSETPQVDTIRGGILCEELGTGKTVMILGLILSTLNQLPSPPETPTGEPTILTPLAFKSFPSGEYASSRSAVFGSRFNSDDSISRVPTLVELLLHHVRAMPYLDPPSPHKPGGRRLYQKRLELESKFEMTPMSALFQQNIPFYLIPPKEEKDSYWSYHRNRTQVGPRMMYISSATLVVVPANLIGQWDREINKHCERQLRVLILRSGVQLPSARVLATDYDIVLMTYNRYTAEAARKDVSKLHSLPFCKCSNFPGSQIPDCKCPDPADVSPFLRVRWKRLVIDEGHVSATLSTNLVPFTKLLSVERRWIVTGTPTTNLLGLDLGKKEVTWDSERDSHSDQENDAGVENGGPRPWTKYDREDLAKLDNMITHFLAAPQFIANTKLMQTHLRDPLMHKEGPRVGSLDVLLQILNDTMFRHRIEDVEKDITLPPVVYESVLLDLDPVVIKSYNALQATIAINAIDSQRTDQDYLFHPRNTEFLQVTVKNMSQLMFWSVDETLYNVDQLVKSAQATIDLAMERNMSPEDIKLVQEAFHHIRVAADDSLWRRIQTHEDVPYRIYNMSDKIFDAWTRTPRDFNPADNATLVGFLHADRLLKLYDIIIARPLMKEDLIAEHGLEVAKRDLELRKAFEEAYNRKNKNGGRKYTSSNPMAGANAKSNTTEAHAEYMVENAVKKAVASNTLKEMRKELGESLAKLERDEEEEGGPSAPVDANKTSTGASPGNGTASGSVPSVLVHSSALAKVVVGSSASTKLNYIIDEVQKHSADEKFLIFSDSPLTLAHVAEALELIQVKFLRFTTQIQPQVREQLVLTFETSETYRVFLMELKHGARGLNLISASRIIFCEPVWQADVESQAIKRAHRIGQTRSITVKTLAIRGTAEENMVERRSLLKETNDKTPKLIEESGMRHFIANPKFLSYNPERLPTVEFPLIHPPKGPVSPSSNDTLKVKIPALHPPTSPSPGSSSSSGQKRVLVEEPLDEQNSPAENADRSPPKKKQRGVHFG